MIGIHIHTHSLTAIAQALNATETQMEQALRSAKIKMAAWLRTRSVRGLSDALQLQQNIVRRRLRTYRQRDQMKVWYGLNPVPLLWLKPKATPSGVSALGGRQIKGAFIATVRGKRQVLKRLGRARYPVAIQKADIYAPAMTYIENGLLDTATFEARFYTLFEHELQWRTHTPT
ncbi:hypothetical protein HKJ31_02205 [Xylella fastidiosa subsp. multiplex]|uniref:hypothetical protein n=1 Tax=Xylella fastidiosa TaxID=2371 RepID=UPI0014642A20|nr:hypothetical protein [Xylella fastidiosa]QJP47729.1 hypothetical protein HKJ31_02205 [Xylella fastidiosa subsp. multiplex]